MLNKNNRISKRTVGQGSQLVQESVNQVRSYAVERLKSRCFCVGTAFTTSWIQQQ